MKWKKPIQWISFIVLMISSLALAYYLRASQPSSQAEIITHKLVIPGHVESVSQNIQLTFEQPGKIWKIYIKEGDQVEKGQLIAEQYHDDLKAQLEVEAWELNQARIEINHYHLDTKHYQNKLQRRKQLAHKGALSKEDLEQVNYEYQKALQQLAVAEAEAHKIQARIKEHQALLDKMQLRAPIQGKIIRLYAREGEAVLTSIEPNPIALIADMEHLQVRAEVDEAEFNRIKLGQKAWVTAAAFANTQIPAQVIQMLDVMGKKKINTENPLDKIDADVLEIILSVPKHELLKLGLRVDVTLEL